MAHSYISTSARFVDAHHIQHWADGSETMENDLAVLGLLQRE